jgi:hypothetical protein
MTPIPPSAPSLDLVTVLVALLSAFLSAEAANAVATYAVILVAAIGGASWSAASRGTGSVRGTWGHMFLMVGLALIGSVPLAELAARVSGVDVRWMFAPVAVLISARPDWVVSRIRQLFDRRLGTSSEDPR